MNRPVRAAVIGLGSFGKNHCRVYADLPNVELVAVCDTNKELFENVRRNGAKEYTDHKEMLKNEQLDLVSLVVPTKLHHKIALDVLNAKVNLLVEKPIASTLEEARDIINTAKANKVKLTVGHIERFNPAIIELKKRIKAGDLGKIYRVIVSRLGPFPERIRDVGVVIDLAVHDLDILRYLTDSEVDYLYARTEKRIHTAHEDILSAILTLNNKIICTLNIDWLTPAKIRLLRIVGEKGMFVADYLSQALFLHENAAAMSTNFDYADIMRGISVGRKVNFDIQKAEPLQAELSHFVDCVMNDKEPLVSGEDGMKALELAMDLINSSNTNQVIKK